MSIGEPCPSGAFSDESGQFSCRDCPRGRYQLTTGAAKCTLCPLGKYNGFTGSEQYKSCLECHPGSYANQNGTAECSPCSKGQFQSESGKTQCHVCTEYFNDELLTSNGDFTGCVENGALLSTTMLEAFYKSGVALSSTFVVTAVFVGVAAMTQIMRERDSKLARLTRLEMVINSAFPGFSFGSELFLVIGMLIEDPGLGASMFIFRLLHTAGAMLLIVSTYGKKRLASNFDWLVRDVSRLREKIDDTFSMHNTYFIACVTVLGLCDITMLQFLPWKASRFYKISEGFPSLAMMRLCLIIKVVQSAVSVICQITYLAKTSNLHDPTTTPQAKALFGMNIIVSTVGVFLWLMLWILKGGRLLKAEGNADRNTGKDDAECAATEPRVVDPEISDVYEHMDGSLTATNPLHGTSTLSGHSIEAKDSQIMDVSDPTLYSSTTLTNANPFRNIDPVEPKEITESSKVAEVAEESREPNAIFPMTRDCDTNIL